MPEPRKIVAIRMDDTLYARVRDHAKRQRRTVSDAIRILIEDHVLDIELVNAD